MNAWLHQPGQNTQANIDAIRAQAEAAGFDPNEIGGDSDSPPPYSPLEINPPADKPHFVSKKPTDHPPPYTHTSDNGKPGPAGGKYDDLIAAAAKKYGVPEALIKAVIEQESGGDPNAVNATSGCTGLMQLKPQYFGQDGANLTDPAINIDRGTAELARLLHVKGGDPVAALAAYNLGEYADIDSTVPGQNGLTGRQYAHQVLARFQ